MKDSIDIEIAWGGYYAVIPSDGSEIAVFRLLDFNREAYHATLYKEKFSTVPELSRLREITPSCFHVPMDIRALLKKDEIRLIGVEPLTHQSLKGYLTYLEVQGVPEPVRDELAERLIEFSHNPSAAGLRLELEGDNVIVKDRDGQPLDESQPDEPPQTNRQGTRGGGMLTIGGVGGAFMFVLAAILLRAPLEVVKQGIQGDLRQDGGSAYRASESYGLGAVDSGVDEWMEKQRKFKEILAFQKQEGMSDDDLDMLLKDYWKSQNQDAKLFPWQVQFEAGELDWRLNVDWNVQEVKQLIEASAGEGSAMSPVVTAEQQEPREHESMTNSIGMKLKLIPAGTFRMGSAGGFEYETPHQVTLTQPFYLGVYEVTQEQYARVMGENPSLFQGPQHPVEQVSWDDAVEFCDRLSELPEEKAAGRAYRLPTEAEWEYACRAGTTSEYNFGDDASQLGKYAWIYDNSGDSTHPVGQKQPNPWGLYDIHGNVLEWCQDWYGDDPEGPATDPEGPATGSYRVFRGGSWDRLAEVCGSSVRDWVNPSARSVISGFRVALVPSSSSAGGQESSSEAESGGPP